MTIIYETFDEMTDTHKQLIMMDNTTRYIWRAELIDVELEYSIYKIQVGKYNQLTNMYQYYNVDTMTIKGKYNRNTMYRELDKRRTIYGTAN